MTAAMMTTPAKKRGNQIVHLFAQARLSQYRREAVEAVTRLRRTGHTLRRQAEETAPPTFLLAVWEGDRELLRQLIDAASDWGPFELTAAKRAPSKSSPACGRVICRFDYHGPQEARAHHEHELVSVLRRITRWEFATLEDYVAVSDADMK